MLLLEDISKHTKSPRSVATTSLSLLDDAGAKTRSEPLDLRQLNGTRRHLRQVRFNEDANQYFSQEELEFTSHYQEWYDREDYAFFRYQSREVLRRFHNEDALLTELLKDIYANLCDVDFVCWHCDSLWTAQQKQMLSNLFNTNPELVGLGPHLVPAILRDVTRRRESLYDVVYDIRHECLLGLLEEHDPDEEMHECCLTHSQVPVLFAQVLATA